MMTSVDLEYDLLSDEDLATQLQDDPSLAKEWYAALCNNLFRHNAMTEADRPWVCTWRYAGMLVADIVDVADDTASGYLRYYGSGYEGAVTPRVKQWLTDHEWYVAHRDSGEPV